MRRSTIDDVTVVEFRSSGIGIDLPMWESATCYLLIELLTLDNTFCSECFSSGYSGHYDVGQRCFERPDDRRTSLSQLQAATSQ